MQVPLTVDRSPLTSFNKETRPREEDGLLSGMAGDGLLSHDLAVVVPSALRGLTTVFGMGTGVAPAR